MKGKELILATLNHEKTPRPAWVPFAGVHAGKLAGYTAKEIMTNETALIKSLEEVNRLYMPDGQPIMFDLQMEAEILGCELKWAENNPPSVMTHPFETATEVPNITIKKTDGRIPLALHACSHMKEHFGDSTAIYGLFTGPFTLVSHLMGTKLFMDMRKNKELVIAMMDYATQIAYSMIDFYAEAGADVLAPVDPLVSQISPKNFADFLSEPYSKIFNYIREKNLKSAFFVCGNATRNIESMCQTKPDCISVDENVDLLAAKETTDSYGIAISGNIPLTTTMLFGNQQDNMKYVVNMIDSCNDTTNLIIAPGCDMPYDVPVENTIAAAEAVINTDSCRKMVENYEAEDTSSSVVIPDYANLEKPLVEAFTLDSDSCAACTYMWAVATEAKEALGDKVDVVEYKYTTKEGVAQCKAMGVTNLPAIYINGELKHSSLIPTLEELLAEIKTYM